ncbi:MAG: 50S ribosomal protein L4 [Paludibacteraceae bacterium]|nr:50S ribosomal protein L4 [Paludibacteraceae bacterium]MBP6283982.1 50S ribosomal protein L4 [Paludibacteraceae bacterium]
MELSIYNIDGQDTGRVISLDDTIFGIEPNDHAIYLDVKQHMANKRQGTHKAKGRSEVTGSRRKLGRQKGGGGARPGDIKSPIRVGGGRVFGPVPRDYSFKINKKVKQLARKSALAYKVKNNQLIVLEDFSFDTAKTKAYIALTKNLKVNEKKTLLVLPEPNKSVYLSARNLEKSKVIILSELNTYKILDAQYLMLTEKSVANLVQNFNA